MEKEHQPDSMATITMKPEYPPSEVYSASEPPPAYRQRVSSSVQIARIAALTVVAASFILGSFILASSWVAARASCHQLEQLDAMLDKELALEGRSYGNDALMADEPLPIANAHALHAAPPVETTSAPAPKPVRMAPDSLLKEDPLNHAESKVDEDKLQNLDDDKVDTVNSGSDESSESDSSGEEEDDDLMPKFTMPIRFDLDEIAGAFLANNNHKGRMNCVVERRHEEPMAEKRFPFNIISALTSRGAPTERVSIICHGGAEERAPPMFVDPQSQVFAFPLSGPVRLPIRPAPERPEPQEPFKLLRSLLEPSPMMQRPWESSEEQMTPPREMRIHVQRIFGIPAPHNMPPPPENMGPFQPPPPPQQEQNQREQEEMMGPRQMRVIAIPAPHNMPPPPESMGPFQPPPPPQRQEQEQSAVLHQFVPQTAPTQELEQPEVQKMQMEGNQGPMNLPWDLTPEDLHMIHRTAQEAVSNQRREQQMQDSELQEGQLNTIVNTLAAAEAEAEAQEQGRAMQDNMQGRGMQDDMQGRGMQDMQGRGMQDMQGRGMQDNMEDRMQSRAPPTLLLPQDMQDQRPHYMQPRSVRSVDSPLHRDKRVKRCACNCV